jgi:aflatoxin B1 aldehyde reductase
VLSELDDLRAHAWFGHSSGMFLIFVQFRRLGEAVEVQVFGAGGVVAAVLGDVAARNHGSHGDRGIQPAATGPRSPVASSNSPRNTRMAARHSRPGLHHETSAPRAGEEELMSTERPPVTNIILGTMTLSYRGYGSRVNDTETASTMLNMFGDAGYRALDTAQGYGGGSGEQMLGDLGAAQRFTIATRYDPQGANHAQERDKLKAAFRLSLTRLRTGRVKILYLTTRDHLVPLESTLRGIQDLHDEGLFDEFGLSNFSVADIEDVLAITAREGWICPTVYEGLYNALARVVETELFPALAAHGMRFQAYNPLAGGAFAPNFGTEESVAPGSRFDAAGSQGRMYRDRYWSDAYISAVQSLQAVCAQFDIDAISAALRWLVHHSKLDSDRDDAIIIGASSISHLQHNLSAVKQGPLPRPVLDAVNSASETVRPDWPSYFFVL